MHLPSAYPHCLIGLLLGAGLLSGCTTSGADADLAPVATYAYGGADELLLPETVAVIPSSFDGTTPSAGAEIAVAAAAVADAAEPPVMMAEVSEAVVQPAAFAKLDAPRGALDTLIAKYATIYEVPETLVRRVVKRESTFNPRAYNNGHWGLMQIKHATARGMGYDGPANGLLDAETNLKYAVKYLRGAWLVAQGDQERADRLYQRGYYYDAKRMGLLEETGLGKDRRRRARNES